MDFKLSEQQADLRSSTRAFAQRHFADKAFSAESRTGFLWDHARLLAKHGYTGIDFPTEDGGQGGSLLDAIIVLEEVTRIDPHAGDVVQAFNFGGVRQLQSLGTIELKERWLPGILAGDVLVSVAMSEPGAGSDLASISTKATMKGNQVLINGQKIFSSHGLDATLLVVWCRFGDGKRDIGAVVVPTDSPGFSRGPAEEYMSGEHYCTMYFDDCTTSNEHVLLTGDAFRRMMPIFNVERLGNAARSLALASTAYSLAVDHAKSRQVSGRPLKDLQGLRWKFADMRMLLDASELLLYRAAIDLDRTGFPTDEYSSIAKCYVNEAAYRVANEALQIFGGYGYSKQLPLEYILRRVRGWMIAGGPVEVLRNRIAHRILD